MSDQQRADAMGCAGNPIVQTPHLDALAARGVRFGNACVQSPVCMASRAAIHTGRYPHTLRVPSMGLLPPTETTIAAALKAAGYSTGMFGKLHLTPQAYTINTRGHDRPVEDPGWFLADAGLDTPAMRAAVEEMPNYGFDESVGVEDMLWGYYVDWLAERAPELVTQHVCENWWNGIVRDGVEYGTSPPARRMFHPTVGDFFDSPIPAELHPSRFIVDRSIDFIRRHAEEPFFVHCSFVDPHHPFNAPQPYASMYSPAEMPIPPQPEFGDLPQRLRGRAGSDITRHNSFPDELWQWARANYFGMVSNLDACIGLLMEELGRLGIRDNTIVIFTSDHGEFVGGHRLLYKGSLIYDDLMRVPLIIDAPELRPHGTVVDELVQEVDIFPTIMSLLGLPIHAGVQGHDLVPLLTGDPRAGATGPPWGHRPPLGRPWSESEVADPMHPYEATFCELDDLKDAHYVDSVAVRTREWKLNLFPGSDAGMLFNLSDDPEESHNLFGDPGYANVRQELAEQIVARYHRMKDPLPVRLSGA